MRFNRIQSTSILVTALMLLQTSGNAQQMLKDLVRFGIGPDLDKITANLDTIDSEAVTKKYGRFLDGTEGEGENVEDNPPA